MNELENILRNLVSLDEDVLLKAIYSKNEVEEFIVSLNTEGVETSQLYERGIDADGKQLEPPYTPRTIELKLSGSGDKRVDHVTLKDTGDFYRSFKVRPLKDGFEIEADPIKEAGPGGFGFTDLVEKYGEKIIGLTDENKEILSEFLVPYLQEAVRKKVLG